MSVFQVKTEVLQLGGSQEASFIYKPNIWIRMASADFKPKIFENTCNFENVNAITAYYQENGFVLIDLLTPDECRKNVLEQWEKIILQQPWKDDIRLKKKNYDTGHNIESEDDFYKYVTQELSDKQLKAYKDGWPMHRGFGACCDPVVFHLPEVWKIREKPLLYEVAVRVLQEPKLWVSIDRSIQKLPTEGDEEFLHLDVKLDDAVNLDAPSMMQGKVCYTQSQFVLVPGSHKLLREIPKHYDHKNMNKAKYSFQKQPDKLHFIQDKKTIKVPAGHAIFWNSHLVHGTQKLKRKACIQYGAYIGFMPARNRIDYHKKCHEHESCDRISSYEMGDMPKLYPSLDPIHFYPKMWNCWSHILKKYIEKLAPDKEYMIKVHLLKNGTTMDIIVPNQQPDYQPTPLSQLGQLLLGLHRWPRIHFNALDHGKLTWPQVQEIRQLQASNRKLLKRQRREEDVRFSSNLASTDTLQTNLYILRL